MRKTILAAALAAPLSVLAEPDVFESIPRGVGGHESPDKAYAIVHLHNMVDHSQNCVSPTDKLVIIKRSDVPQPVVVEDGGKVQHVAVVVGYIKQHPVTFEVEGCHNTRFGWLPIVKGADSVQP